MNRSNFSSLMSKGGKNMDHGKKKKKKPMTKKKKVMKKKKGYGK